MKRNNDPYAALEAEIAQLTDERDDALLRADRAEELMSAMAARLDELEPSPHNLTPPSGRVGVAWRGPARNYWDNSGQINHELALAASEMLQDVQKRSESPESTPNPQGALNAQAIEANSRTDEEA